MKIRNLFIAAALAGASASAIAEDENKFYAGSGAGLYYVDFDDLDFDESAPTLRIFGGYELNQHLSFELGFTNLFESSGSVLGADIDVDGTAWDLRVQPTLPINDQFSAFGIVGWTRYDFEVSASLGPVTVSDDEILAAIGELARTAGVFAEPAAAAPWAAAKQLAANGRIEKDETVVLLITGNGLKDVASVPVGEPVVVDADPEALRAML